MRRIDLHTHSNCSDGTLSPKELVELANKKHLCAFALTDHDTIDGIEAAQLAASIYNIEVIPGIELSTAYKNKDIHILGLGIDITNIYFLDSLKKFQEAREWRDRQMIEKLRTAGIDITYEEMVAKFPNSVFTRAHFARFIYEAGHVTDMWDAFPKYIGDDAPCFVPREKVTPYQAIDLIHEGGGYAILAHPLLYKLKNQELEQLIASLKKSGLDGLEVPYSMNRYGDEAYLRQLAKKHNLKISGGSDFHGSNKPNIQLGSGRGNLNISYDVWKAFYS